MYDNGNQYTKNDHGTDGEIKPEVFLFYPDITRQPADPVEPVVKKIHNQTGHNDHSTNDQHAFSGMAIHAAKITLN